MVWVAGFFLLHPVVGHGESDAGPGARQLELGRRVFNRHCAECHGESGDGYGERSDTTYVRPRSFLAARFKLTTTENRVPSDADLEATIRRGMPGGGMPNWGWLPDEEIVAVARYVRHLGVEAQRGALDREVARGRLSAESAAAILARRTVPAAPISIPPEPPFGEERRLRAQRLYEEACAVCHGVDGEAEATRLRADVEGNWLIPTSLKKGVFKGGGRGEQLYARILKGMNGTAMPGFESLARADELWDLVHYVQSLSTSPGP